MMQASHAMLHRLMQSLGQEGWPLRLWVYLMPFSLLWVSSDLPFPFVTSKALLITLWALMGLAVLMFHRSSIRVTRFDLLLLGGISLGLLTGFANGNPALSFYSTLERCNGVVLQLMLFLYLVLLRNAKLDWRIYWSVVLLVASIVWVDLLIRNGLHWEFEVASLLGNEAYLAGFLMLWSMLLFVICGAIHLILDVGGGTFEFLDSLTQSFGQFRQFFCAKHDQNDGQDQDDLAHP